MFDFLGKKPKGKDLKVTVKMTLRGADSTVVDIGSAEFRRSQEEWELLERERKRAQEKKQAENRSFLSEAGVDVAAYTPGQVISDAITLIDSKCPSMQTYNCDLHQSEPDIVFSSLTKTGRVPKNVVVAHIFTNEMRVGPLDIEESPHFGNVFGLIDDNLIVHLHYLADGTINMAEVFGWHAQNGQGVIIRRFGDEHRIVEVKISEPKGEKLWTSLYKNPKPVSNDIGLMQLDKSVRHIFAR